MPYELLYSRTIAGEGVVRYTDVPITDKSVMIEVLSLLSPFRRIAGYAYALRSDGITDYERSGGVTLPFGKNRVNFAVATVPYGLEFFPKWGMKTGIISVYIGEPGSTPPPPRAWIYVPSYDTEFRRAQSPSRLEYRQPVGSAIVQSMALGLVEGGYAFAYFQWKKNDGTYWYSDVNNLSFEGATTEAAYLQFMSYPETIVF